MSKCTQSLVGGRLREDPKYDDTHTPAEVLPSPVSLTPCASVSTHSAHLPTVSAPVSLSTSPSEGICKVSPVVLTRQNFFVKYFLKLRGRGFNSKV